MKLGLGVINLLGEVKAELRIGEPVVNEGGGGMSAEVGGRLEGGTGAVGIIGNGGIVVVEVGGTRPWFMSKNFLAFLTTSSEVDSDLFRFFGVDESADPGLEAGSFLLPSGFTAARFLDFFFVVEVVGVGVTPGVATPSDVYSIRENR